MMSIKGEEVVAPVTSEDKAVKRVELRYCPDHGLPLEITYEKNRVSYAIGGDFGYITMGDDFDTKTGEALFLIVGHCPVKESGWFADKNKSHYSTILEKGATRLTTKESSPLTAKGEQTPTVS